jgi:hypothetical protein
MTTSTQTMLNELTQAVNQLTAAHRALAQLLAQPESSLTLDDIVKRIHQGHADLETAEHHRQAWLAEQADSTQMPQALMAAERLDNQTYLSSWQQLQPQIESLSRLMQQHQLILGRLGVLIQEQVNLLTHTAENLDTTVYAASGKTEQATDRRRSLGDA